MIIFVRHVVGKFFFDWSDIFLFGRARSKSECVSGKLGMKLAIDYITRFSNRKSYAAYAF